MPQPANQTAHPSKVAPTKAMAEARERRSLPEDLTEIAVEAYVYAYPLVLMEVTRQLTTNVTEPKVGVVGLGAPMNQFVHLPAFPDASFTAVVRPNADTLYSSLWFDVSREPLVVHVPDSGDRYYLLEMLDMWTDVFASPGKRTTGTGAQTFAIVGPQWSGVLPEDVKMLRAPTNLGWIIGRTQTNGAADYEAVHAFQSGMRAVPLTAWGHYHEPPKGKIDPSVPSIPPGAQVEAMEAASFFDRFLEIVAHNPPHANDYPILARLERIGLVPGRPFAHLPAVVQDALNDAPLAALRKIQTTFPGRKVNGWTLMEHPIGTYGTDYLTRAIIAHGGLGANTVEDAFYPTAFNDSEGRPLDASCKYIVHFDAADLPPVRAFWSLTLYDDRQLFADNPIGRYAIGDRDPLRFNPDGSLDVFIQRESPGEDREPNWLPTPTNGTFTMNLRLYWPEPSVVEGAWEPPPIECVG